MNRRLHLHTRAIFLRLMLTGALLCALVPVPVWATEAPLVFAASSLRDGLDAVLAAYQREHHRSVRVSYAGTPVLARQIEAGAPAQLFFSADQLWMDYLQERELLDESSRANVLANRLVLASSSICEESVNRIDSAVLDHWLGPDGRLAIAHPNTVPAGRYGRAALSTTGLWAGLQGRLVEVENVRLALMLAARGEVPLALVYASDALAQPSVAVCHQFAVNSHPPIHYPLATVKGAASAASNQLMEYLRGVRAAQIWQAFGFEPLSGSGSPAAAGSD